MPLGFGWALSRGCDAFLWLNDDIPLRPDALAGLIEPSSKTMKAARVAYAQFARWLQGSTLKECSSKSGIWTCEIVDRATQPAWIRLDRGKRVAKIQSATGQGNQ